MSQKITSKNLSYDTSLPPFLAALKAQAAGASGPDPLLAANRRSGKKRSGSEEAEDVPLVVDEHGNVVTVEVDKDGEITKQPVDESSNDAQKDTSSTKEDGDKADTDTKASIGGRKRKVGRVIGEAADEPDNNNVKSKKDEKEAAELPKDKKTKKKAKKIKLSFDEDAG
ncbi:hypothetical protein HJFPF1_07052 [Paramyrothecium foliicola]|nr:hypothetical protein HJFPF1_07052 [Paramyrothecium foliicola]